MDVQRISPADPTWPSHAEHDVLLPVQFSRVFSRDLKLERERLLMFAVLEDGITSYLNHAHARNRRGREAFAEAHAWVSSTEQRRLFAFETICDVLGIDAGSLRRALDEQHTRRRRQLRCRPLSTAGRASRTVRPRHIGARTRRPDRGCATVAHA